DAVADEAVDEDEVAERLAHLLALVGDHPGMRVGGREGTAEADRMGGAEVVMGEHEVAAAGLDVEGQAKALLGDGDALHVPAGAAPAEGAAVPGRLPLALGAPQQRVEAAPLALAVGVPAPVGEDVEHLLLGPAGDVSEGAVEGEVVVPVV